ncbi:sensor histidine kinase [Eilatimonas milleporae]|uniref:histidine kinase n=1 Tax=Eilatimonas milleporae TaxID=911205 RepID=A0A3M0CT11_9PROT|nr:sensor histidine kinase [Eilatimonas milleporae]RMB12055.1 signal transduction histidine kinase [Eilatimonas milleporae]
MDGERRNPRQFLRTLTGRLLIAATLWSALALSVGEAILSYAFERYVLEDMDDRLSVLLDTLIGNSEIGRDGVLRFSRPLFDQRFDSPYSGWYWQISEAGERPFRSRSLWDFALQPDLESQMFDLRLSEGSGPGGQTLRIAERDIILPEAERIFRYQVATDTAGIKRAISRFNWLLVAALGVMMVIVTLALIIQVAYGLRPLRSIRRKLTDVRAGHAARLEGSFPEDLRPIAQEINALIDQNQRLVKRARTHVGNLAHALKTPLSVLQNETDELPETVSRRIRHQVDTMRGQIDHHLKRARIAGGGTGPGVPISYRVDKLIHAVSRMRGDKEIKFIRDLDAGLMFDGETADFDEIVGNLLDNAGKWAASRVAISAHRLPDDGRRAMMELSVGDDGPGVPREERDRLFERGQRLDERVPGSGLGLSIVRDIVDMYGGLSRLDQSSLGGLEVVVILPLKGHDATTGLQALGWTKRRTG